MSYGMDDHPAYMGNPGHYGFFFTSYVLKSGDTGAQVTQLQNLLVARLGASALPVYGVDGQYGSETEAAVRAFQSRMPGLDASGKVDEATWAALTGPAGVSTGLTPGLVPAGATVQEQKDAGHWASILGDAARGFASGYKPPSIISGAGAGAPLPGQPGYVPRKEEAPGWLMPVLVIGGLALVGGLLFAVARKGD